MTQETTAFTARTVPWGKLKDAALIDGDVSAAEAMRLAKLDFDIKLVPIRFRSTRGGWETHGGWKDYPNRVAVIRGDTDEPFDVVSQSGYEPVQYRDAFSFMDEVSPRYVAAASLLGGRQAVLVVQHPDLDHLSIRLGGQDDPHDLYVVLRTSHDRSRAIEVAAMPLARRCMNALTVGSFTADVPQHWSVKHIKTVHEKMHEASKVWANLGRYAEAYAKNAELIASVELDLEQGRELLRRVLPNRPRRDDTIDTIIGSWRSNPAVGFPGSGWGLLQGVSEYFEWGRKSGSRTPQSQLLGSLQGSTHKAINRAAAELIREAHRRRP